MDNHPLSLHMNQYDFICAFLGGVVLLLGLISFVLKEKLFIADSLTATLLGIAFGPIAMKLLDPSKWPGDLDRATFEFADFVINIQIMAAAVALPTQFWKTSKQSLAMLLGPVTIFMWLSAAVIFVLVFKMPWPEALILAACTAPTDPVLANSIVHGRFADLYIPKFIQCLLSAESTVNDGIAAPLFYLALYLYHHAPLEAFKKWSYTAVLYEMGGAIIMGAIIGFLMRFTLRFSFHRKWIDKKSFLIFELALATMIQGLSSILRINVFLAVFITGFVFSWDGWFHEATEDEHVQKVIDMIVNLVFFLYFGVTIPWSQFHTDVISLSQLFLCTGLILVFRRLPIMLACSRIMSPKLNLVQGVLMGWFGPIGVGAIWYQVLASQHLPDNMYFKPIVHFIVLCSVVVHGVVVPLIHVCMHYLVPSFTLSTPLSKEQPLQSVAVAVEPNLKKASESTPSPRAIPNHSPSSVSSSP